MISAIALGAHLARAKDLLEDVPRRKFAVCEFDPLVELTKDQPHIIGVLLLDDALARDQRYLTADGIFSQNDGSRNLFKDGKHAIRVQNQYEYGC